MWVGPTRCQTMQAHCASPAVGGLFRRPATAGTHEQPLHGARQPRGYLRLTRQQQRGVVAMAKEGKARSEPPDVPKPRDQPRGGKEWLQSILSRFGPVKERAANTTVLDFEKPLVELDNRIKEVGRPGAWGRACSAPHAAGAHVRSRDRAAPHSVRRRSSTLAGRRATSAACWRPAPLQVRRVAEENGVDVSASVKELEERARQVRCTRVARGVPRWHNQHTSFAACVPEPTPLAAWRGW